MATPLPKLPINNPRPAWLELGALFSLAFVLSLVFLWPVMSNFSTHLTSQDDGLFIVWLLHWVSTSLTAGRSIFDAPIFYPYQQTLAYSQPFLSTALLSIPVLPFIPNLIALHNWHLFWGAIAVFGSMYLLIKNTTDSALAAILAAVIFTFSSYHFHYVVHLHMFLVAGLPLSVYCLQRWLSTQKLGFLIGCLLSFWYQVFNDPMTGFFVVVACLAVIANHHSLKIITAQLKNVLLCLLVCLLPVLLFYHTYWQVSQEFEYTRTIRDAAHFAHSLNIFVTTEFVLIVGVILGLYFTSSTATWRLHRKALLPALIITIVGAVLMLGPALKLNHQTIKFFSLPIPLPYAVLYYLVPGFQAFRATSRWILVMGFGLAWLAGVLTNTSQLRPHFKLGIILGLGTYFWFTQVPNLELFAISTAAPAIYAHLPTEKSVVAEFPVLIWRMMPYSSWENERLLYQTTHQQRLFNGTSGFTPPARESDVLWLWRTFPQPDSITYLQQLGVSHIIVHYHQYQTLTAAKYAYENHQAPAPENIKMMLHQNSQLTELVCIDQACLYKIGPDE
ncbi:MAG TPA: hypothetical protein VD999_04775 [Vitreimonas sp.]|nr:hypothetical protein [Vitreimonas sp.]